MMVQNKDYLWEYDRTGAYKKFKERFMDLFNIIIIIIIVKGKVFCFSEKKNKNSYFSATKINFAAATCLLTEKYQYFRKIFFCLNPSQSASL